MFFPTRLGAYAWIERDGLILLSLWEGNPEHDIPPHWNLPGGGVEWGEQVSDAVVREVFEETGYTVSPGPIAELHQVYLEETDPRTTDAIPIRLIWSLSRANIVGGHLTDEVGGSSLRAAWFSRDAIDGLPQSSVLSWALSLPGFQ